MRIALRAVSAAPPLRALVAGFERAGHEARLVGLDEDAPWADVRLGVDVETNDATISFMPPEAIPDAPESDRLHLILVSRALCEPGDDWPSSWRVVGRPREEEAADAAEIADYLQAGGPPLAMDLPEPDYRELAMLAEAARLAGQRAVIVRPGEPAAIDDTILYSPKLPRRSLARCRAVVHAGSAASTHAACLAGVPSVVLAGTPGQAFWAGRLWGLGVAPEPIERGLATGEGIAAAVRRVREDPFMLEATRELAMIARREDAPAAVVREVERVFGAG